MTVCIAAICTFHGGPMIVAAADRMITAADIEFQQPQPKAFQLGEHSVSLIFGNVAEQAMVATSAQREVISNRITSIEDIARIYAMEYGKRRRSLAEAILLAPLALDADSFLLRQQSLDTELVRNLTAQLQERRLDRGGGAIVAGADTAGCHLYLVGDPGVATCMDSIGFIAGGGGQWHAESQFMFFRYVKTWDFEAALFLTYMAKKRAEVAPGVGNATDIVLITTNPRQIHHFPEENPAVAELERIYQEGLNRQNAAHEWAYGSVRAFVQRALTGAPAAPPPPPTSQVSSPETASAPPEA